MASCWINHLIFIFVILFVVSFTESRRCPMNCTFQGLHLHSSISSDYCPSLNQSNDNINQACAVKLSIDFTTGLVNGSFYVENQSLSSSDKLNILSIFSLNDTSTTVEITYICSVSDYCNFDFIRETLSSALAAVQIEPLRQELAVRLYNPNNIGAIRCLNNTLCAENTSLCSGVYIRTNKISGDRYDKSGACASSNSNPQVYLIQSYAPYQSGISSDIGVFYCNTPNCSSNTTIIETFQWLTQKHILPLNFSVVNVTTTMSPTTSSTTPSNHTTPLCGHFHYFIPYIIIILILQQNLFQMFL
ncbi:unnamed protein product [Adineta steineri]|uniref:Uncharacterized protein n=1 Tax=Adineta steineri TaxID=433720 RepID=A0A814Z3L3_9BILA|nr:unnamed protein product [Adineta steineri]CAF3993089.1 unnamed protein product [Adineta steineri]